MSLSKDAPTLGVASSKPRALAALGSSAAPAVRRSISRPRRRQNGRWRVRRDGAGGSLRHRPGPRQLGRGRRTVRLAPPRPSRRLRDEISSSRLDTNPISHEHAPTVILCPSKGRARTQCHPEPVEGCARTQCHPELVEGRARSQRSVISLLAGDPSLALGVTSLPRTRERWPRSDPSAAPAAVRRSISSNASPSLSRAVSRSQVFVSVASRRTPWRTNAAAE